MKSNQPRNRNRNENSRKQNQPSQKSNITFQNEVIIDAKNPVPFEVKGDSSAFYFDGNQNYIPFLNPNDDFFSILQEASMLSPTTSSCINSKVFFCSGEGIKIKDASDEIEKKWKEFSKRINNRRQSLGKIGDKFFSNYFRVGNVFIEVIKAKVGETKKVFAYVHSYLDCRLGKPDDNDIAQEVIISNRFRKKGSWSLDLKESRILPLYNGENTKWKKDDEGYERCVFHIKNEMDGYDYYGLPENVSSLIWQILESEGASYNLDNFLNNMVIGGAIILQGSFTDDELTTAAKRITQQHTGKGKRGRWSVMGSKQGPGTIQSFQKDTDGNYLKLDENAEKKIIDANNWDKVLYGGSENKGLGNGGNSYLRNIFKIKHKTVVGPVREIFFEEFLLPFLEITDEFTGTKWSENEFVFKSINIEDLVEDIDINKIITVDEGREMISRDKLGDERGSKIISENKGNVQNK